MYRDRLQRKRAKFGRGGSDRKSKKARTEKSQPFSKNPVNPCKYAPSKTSSKLACHPLDCPPFPRPRIDIVRPSKWAKNLLSASLRIATLDGLGVRASGAKNILCCLSACKHSCASPHTSVISSPMLLKHPEPELNEWGRRGERTR